MAAPDVDTVTYDKHAKHVPGFGYEARRGVPTSIVVHSTSNPNQKNTAFKDEAKFLFDAALVGAHYLIGKDGAVVRFLDPRPWAAWHAGNCRPDWANQKSIGIELHHSVGDPPYPQAQLGALAALLRSLMALFNIPVEKIETHGQIALPGPYARKHDPSDWSYASFVAFRARLGASPDLPPPAPPSAPVARAYRVRGGLPVYQRPERTGPLWGFLAVGEKVVVDETGHLLDERGWVDLNGLVAL